LIHLFNDLKNNNKIMVKLIPSEDMVADDLTTACNTNSLECLKARFFLAQLSPAQGGVLN
jgi:hypothetical protein